jgi:hypothetical protein
VHHMLQCSGCVRHALLLGPTAHQLVTKGTTTCDTFLQNNSTCGRDLRRVYSFTWILHGGHMAPNFNADAEGVC